MNTPDDTTGRFNFINGSNVTVKQKPGVQNKAQKFDSMAENGSKIRK